MTKEILDATRFPSKGLKSNFKKMKTGMIAL